MLIGLVGCGGFGREVMPILRETRGDATLAFVETTRGAPSLVNGYRVLSEAEFFADPDADKRFNVAIADSQARETIAARFLAAGATPTTLRSLQTTVYDDSLIGEGAILCSGCIVTSNATIGRFFHANLQSYVAHDCVIGDYVTFAPRVACNGNVIVENHAYVGTGAILKQGTRQRPLRIGAGAVVGMGAVVTKDVPAGETWIGNPARPMQRTV